MSDIRISTEITADLPEAFVQELGIRFQFDATRPDLVQELKYIARRYRRDLLVFNNTAERELDRTAHRKLREQIESLRQTLAFPEFEALGSEIYLTLRTANVNADEISRLPILSAAVGDHILRSLDDFLGLVSVSAGNVEQRSAPPKGRKPNFALECLVRNIAYLWADILKRPFTLDYHKGSGVTEAFAFVKAFTSYIDLEIADTKLITAVRTIISERGNIRNPDNA
ncbi:MAG TPA: hypothetical protein PLF84_12700 [Bryobacteraceae bacterium]|nr:hypothetical protein [Bryobacteraceae bacterium]